MILLHIGEVPSDSLTALSSATPTPILPAGQQSDNMSAIVAAMVSILAVSVVGAVSAVFIVILVIRRKRKAKKTKLTTVHYAINDGEGIKDFGNPLYSGIYEHDILTII